jgi:hypothetical protein
VAWAEFSTLSYPVTHPSRNFFVLSLFCVFVHVCMAKSVGLGSSVNKDFLKENDVLIQAKKLKITKLGLSVHYTRFINSGGLFHVMWGLYYKHITIVNDNSRVIRMTLQVATSPTILILMTLEVSFMPPENIYSTGLTRDDCHTMIVIYLLYRPHIT